MIIGKSFFFLPAFAINCVAFLCFSELHRIELLHIEIIDNAGRKKAKVLPIEFICTSQNSEFFTLSTKALTAPLVPSNSIALPTQFLKCLHSSLALK